MKIMIMKCDNEEYWYKDKIGKTYKVEGLSSLGRDYITKNGIIEKADAEIIG